MKPILLIVSLMIATSGLAGGQKRSKDATLSGDAEQKVLEMMRRYVEAYGQNDVAALDKILADDFLFTSSRGIVVAKAQELAEIRSGEMRTESATIDEVRVRVRRDAAVVTARAKLKGVWHGQDFGGLYRVTATWVKEKDRWRLLAEHASRIPQP